jgi:hypothetical protein
MAENLTRGQPAGKGPHKDPLPMDDPVPAPVDPDGAHAKGYSADPMPEPAVKGQDPVPLAAGPDPPSAVQVHERDSKVQPTGRSARGGDSPNDRVTGADR